MVTSGSKNRWRKDALVLSLAALCLRVAISLWGWNEVPPTADGAFYHVVAQRIAQGDGYTWLWPDGVVTYAAHYPVGYPALMGGLYYLFGPVPGVMMLFNSLLGAGAVFATHGLCVELVEASALSKFVRPAALLGASLVAFSPSLLAYTPALMTEAAVGGFVVIAARGALQLRRSVEPSRHAWLLVVFLVGCLGMATLLRPQSILLAPIIGGLSLKGRWNRRLGRAVLVSLGCLVLVAPWTLRNCDKMERCVFVSANGGWNLLIGTFSEGKGAWIALEGERVPSDCREVFQEAAKDQCFGEAGVRRIFQDPVKWGLLSGSKLRATFDHAAAATEHLWAAGAISQSTRSWLMPLELATVRLLLAIGLLGLWGSASLGPPGVRHVLGMLGLVGFGGISVPFGWGAMIALLFMNGRLRQTVAGGFFIGSFLVTASIHAVFFGASRYSLPLVFAAGPIAALGWGWIWKWRGFSAFVSEDFDTRADRE
jgi:hypothetical protein